MNKVTQVRHFRSLYTKGLFLFFIFWNSLNAQTYTTVSALQTAVNAAAATGGTFILKDNTYSNASFSFKSIKATAALPIIIKAETIGGVTLTNDSKFTLEKCSNITVEGFNMNCTGKNSLVKLSGCNNIRFTRNTFKLTISDGIAAVKWFYIGGVWDDIVAPYNDPSHHNRIDHNIFQDKNLPGHYITVDGNNGKDQSQYDRIDHNYFKNNGPRAVNEQESIRVGWSDMSKSSGYTTVEYNLFENCDGDPEIVSVKSCDNIVRHNTFKGCYGSVGFRHGNRNRSEGNYFFGNGRAISTSPGGATLYTGGMRIYGTDHVIINNYFEGLTGTRWDAPITLTQGDVIDGQSTSLSSHFRAERVIVAYNTLVNNDKGIEIGFSNSGKYGKGLADITIANNIITGSKNSLVEILDGKDQGSNITWSNNLFYPTGTATTITGGTSTTSFTTAQAVNTNPNLAFDAAQGTWRSTATTPLYTNSTAVSNNEDIDGQTRNSPSNPGADVYSADLTSVRYMPMTTTTVGPLAYEANDAPSESLSLTAVAEFTATAGSKTTTVTSNVNWTATVNASWVTISPASGSNSGTITVTAAANTATTSRTATLTVVGGTLTRTVTITQAGVVSTTPMINAGVAGAPVTVTATAEQVDATRFNYATNTLDKDTGTRWSDLGTVGNYGVLTYDFGSIYTLESIKIATTGTSSKFYYYKIQFSTDGVNYTAAVDVTSASGTDFKTYTFTNQARYVKVTGGGNNSSAFSTISEIEFYGTKSLSTTAFEIDHKIAVYPVPASTMVTVQSQNLNLSNGTAMIYSIDGRLVLTKKIGANDQDSLSIDVSALRSGNYLLQLLDSSSKAVYSKLIIVSN